MHTLAAALAALVGFTPVKLDAEPTLPAGYLSINPEHNRAARRNHRKLRRSAPGAFGPNQMARIVAWERNHPDVTQERPTIGIFGV